MSTDFDGLAAPARRALANGGFRTLADLAKAREADVAKLHGMGPHALKILRERLARAGHNFA
ncbi:MAG: DNA-binding protein [Pseudomonadota bacterium]